MFSALLNSRSRSVVRGDRKVVHFALEFWGKASEAPTTSMTRAREFMTSHGYNKEFPTMPPRGTDKL